MKSVHAVLIGLAVIASPISSFPASAAPATPAASATDALADAIARRASGPFEDFYASRGYRPLWIDGRIIGADAQAFLKILDDAALDGLKPSRYKAQRLRKAIAEADSGDADALARAEVDLTRAFVRYVQDARRTRNVGVDYADLALKPRKQSPERVLRAAVLGKSFGDYVRSMGWMSPHYVEMREILRTALAQRLDAHVIDTIRFNRERARHLPPASVRHIVVDAASAQLWYYQAGKEVGTMKVVVGAQATQTPLLVGSLNYAIVNPYWNVPDYLIRDNVARKILGGRTLASMHMEALSDWSATPAVLDPATIDWQAVSTGQQAIRLRELPGPHNSMGDVKFVFPNDHGIYLHDTPNRDLFRKDDRHLSNGCIRLEKAWVLGRWMMGKALDDRPKTKAPEIAIPMPATVPVYLTYLTVMRTKSGVAIRPDVYGLDQAKR